MSSTAIVYLQIYYIGDRVQTDNQVYCAGYRRPGRTAVGADAICKS